MKPKNVLLGRQAVKFAAHMKGERNNASKQSALIEILKKEWKELTPLERVLITAHELDLHDNERQDVIEPAAAEFAALRACSKAAKKLSDHWQSIDHAKEGNLVDWITHLNLMREMEDALRGLS